jgi:hypothetical protein
MNRVSVKVRPGADLPVLIDTFAELGRQIVTFSTATALDFLNGAQDLITSAALPGTQLSPSRSRSLTRPCCEIPETECPPKCVCNIDWSTATGNKISANITVTNTGSQTRNFTFTAAPFSGPGDPKDLIQLSPASATLVPGQSVSVAAALTVGSDFQPGQKYTSEIHVLGAYPQCVCVTLNVDCSQQSHPCKVEQGDPPVRIRAHHWYDHFQCEEPCFPRVHDPQHRGDQ